ncbi:acyl-ACP thioesterase domain-containing protein [Klebsiella grimontii]|nr:acyl-ACP thioesterase domain-containing protein [Klebsiella grimontii]
MGKKHTSSYEVAYYGGDFTDAKKIPALLAIVIKVSEEQAEVLE